VGLLDLMGSQLFPWIRCGQGPAAGVEPCPPVARDRAHAAIRPPIMTEHRSDLNSGIYRFTRLQEGGPSPVAWKKLLYLGLVLLASVGAYLMLRAPLGELPARALGLFFFAAVCWATEVIPLYATSFLVVAGQILLLADDGGLAVPVTHFLLWLGLPEVAQSAAGDQPSIAAKAFLAPFSQDIMFLFMGGFLISAAVSRHGLDRVLARLILRPFRDSPLGLLIAIVTIAAGMSMWLSNTATAAMLVAIVRPLIHSIPEKERYRAGIVLAICAGVNIGGIGTPIGTPPNAIAYGALNAAGFEITFLGWMLMAVPLAAVLLIIATVVIWFYHRPSADFVMPSEAFGDTSAPIIISPMAKVTLGVMALAMLGWLTGDLTGIAPGVVALVAAALLTATRALNQHDVDSIDWNVLILIWGGLSLSVALDLSGLSALLAAVDLSHLPGGPLLIGSTMALLAVGLSTFMSNTATAGLLVPMALALSVQDRQELVVLAALACSFAMALPVSTPPNAIVYATGATPLNSMIRMGAIVGLVSIIVMVAGYRLILPMVLDGTP
jgi:sodium-dependent dicarboxylate transporter 2/3/5